MVFQLSLNGQLKLANIGKRCDLRILILLLTIESAASSNFNAKFSFQILDLAFPVKETDFRSRHSLAYWFDQTLATILSKIGETRDLSELLLV